MDTFVDDQSMSLNCIPYNVSLPGGHMAHHHCALLGSRLGYLLGEILGIGWLPATVLGVVLLMWLVRRRRRSAP